MAIAFGKIANALQSAASDHILGISQDIYDTTLNAYQSDLNLKVKQLYTTVNDEYPLLLTPPGQTADSNTNTYFSTNVTINPNLGKITALRFARPGGKSTEFLKADGSLDTNTYLTSHQSLANYVTLNTEQTISGVKKFTNEVQIRRDDYGVRLLGWTDSGYLQFGQFDGENKVHNGNISAINGGTLNSLSILSSNVTISGNTTSAKFITKNGTSSQFVKGDGSLDSNTYAKADNASYSTIYRRVFTVNNDNWAIFSTTSSAGFSIYAPNTAGTSGQYLVSSGSGAPTWTSLTTLKNPYSLKLKNAEGTVVTYDGSEAKDLSGGVYNATISKYIGSYAHTNTCGIKYYYCGTKGDNTDVTGKYVGYDSATTTYQSILRLQSHANDINSLWYIDLIFDVNNGNIWERRVSASNTPVLKQIAWTSDIPITLKNPYPIKFTDISGTAISYDGSSTVDLSSGINYATKSSVANNGIFYIEGTGTTAGTWLGEHDEIKELYKGLTIAYKIPVAGASPTTLKINNLNAVTCYYNSSSYLTTHYGVGSVILLVYDGTYFRISDYDNIHQCDSVSSTASSSATKTASATFYKLRTGNLFICTVYYNNTAASALTLNVNSTGAKPIYINGTASSSTNYTLPAGRYLVYYDGTNYYFYTDGGVKIPQVYGNASTASVLQTARTIWGQSFDGSGNIEGDLTIMARDTDKSIQFLSGTSGTFNWRIAYIGTGTGDTNYLSFESTKGTTSTWEPALQLACSTLNATFAGQVTAPNFIQNSNGTSDFTSGTLKIKALNVLTTATGSTYGAGTSGQILRSNGTNVYWSNLDKLTTTTLKTNQSYSLKNDIWTDTGYSISGLDTGTYMIQVTSTNLVASGVFSVQKSLTDTAGDEIPLHVYSSAGWRPYLRTNGTKLEISANNSSAVSRTVTIKIVQII